MNYIRTRTYCLHELSAREITVEIDIQRGLYHFSIIGMGDKAIDESRERIQSAIRNSGFKSLKSVNQKITALLAPASLKKEGSGFDLAIAVAYLISSGAVNFKTENLIFIGELSLNGGLRAPINYLYLFHKILSSDLNSIIVTSIECRGLCKYFIQDRIIYCENLYDVCSIGEGGGFRGGEGGAGTKAGSRRNIEKESAGEDFEKMVGEKMQLLKEEEKRGDQNNTFNRIVGCESAKRAVAIAVAGRHNLLMVGPPGTGKTLLAKSINEIMLPLTQKESFECSALAQINNFVQFSEKEGLVLFPPFRNPHHTSSYSAIIGDANLNAGEITKAHNGFLFLDELPEFDVRVIDSLREPLESGELTLSKKKGTVTLPANFTLIAAMNPCKCGFHGSSYKKCVCRTHDTLRYAQKISGPMLDRFDMVIHVDTTDERDVGLRNKISARNTNKEVGKEIYKSKISQAVKRAQIRFKNSQSNGANIFVPNGKLKIFYPNTLSQQTLKMSASAQSTIDKISHQMKLSKRSISKILKVSRTIADLEDQDEMQENHIYEALSFRQ